MYRPKMSFFLFIVALLILNACALQTRYKVKVNGFTGGKHAIPSGKKIFIYKNEKAVNPLFEDEIGEKIKIALKTKGYIPVKQISNADYVLHFGYEIDQGSTYSKIYSQSKVNEGNYELNVFTGQFEKTSPTTTTRVGSRAETIYSRQLLLKLFEVNGPSKISKPVWVGEVNSSGSSSDLRKVIDYLILGAFEHFGEDTGGQKRHRFSSSDNPFKKLKKSSAGKNR